MPARKKAPEKGPGPVEVLRDGFLKATIWKNEGENGTYFSTTLAKTYEKDGQPHDGHSFTGADLLRISELARQAYARIRKYRAELPREEAEPTQP